MPGTAYMLGMFAGSFVMGYLSDRYFFAPLTVFNVNVYFRYGRLKTAFLANLIGAVFTLLGSITTNLLSYCFTRFITAFGILIN